MTVLRLQIAIGAERADMDLGRETLAKERAVSSPARIEDDDLQSLTPKARSMPAGHFVGKDTLRLFRRGDLFSRHGLLNEVELLPWSGRIVGGR